MTLVALNFNSFVDYEKSTNEGTGSENSDSLFENLSLEEQSQSRLDVLSSESSRKAEMMKSKRFICYLDTCRKEFSQYCSLQKHERIHKGEKPYVCNTCNHAFTQLSNLKRHERLHTGEKPHVCSFCPKSFSNISNLKQHLQIHEDNNNRSKYICNVCSRSYYYQSSLKKHMKEHEGQIKIEEFDSAPNTDAELDRKSEDEFLSEDLRKIVKIEIESDENPIKSIEINLQVNPEELNKLPEQYLAMLRDVNLMKEMQSIALFSGTCGSNPIESFEHIRQGLSHFFLTKPAAAQHSFSLQMQYIPNEAYSADQSSYMKENFPMEEECDEFYAKEHDGFYAKELSKEFHSTKIKNYLEYLEDFDSSDTFLALEQGL